LKRTILITGGFGFLGRAVARQFARRGDRVLGIGHGRWAPQEARAAGFDAWLDASVSLASLVTLDERFDLVIHCAGNGSVGYSLTNPLQDFLRNVQTTADLLEYLRIRGSKALLVYPSSAGVYGAKDDAPIRESDSLDPISPYGVHKKVVEDLLAASARTYGIRAAVIRFFSVYGPGLNKQLLWDASARLRAARGSRAEFWGTGEETRDWIASQDAARLVAAVADSTEPFLVVNGASGIRVTVRRTLEMLRDALGVDAEIAFSGVVREGDPRHYHADVGRALALGWAPQVTLADGVRAYARWVASHQEPSVD
jgi:UDP-glucose 4-epimerase